MPEQVWREPREETLDLYPGLVVDDGRQSGSITFGQTRLPIWAVVAEAVYNGWESVTRSYRPVEFREEQFVGFLHNLLELRGEFARLLLVLADAERDDAERAEWQDDREPWWLHEPVRERVLEQLRRCVETLEVST